jgi:glutathione S-transferase
MTDEIVFYHDPMSRGRIVHWMLEEVGVPYRIERLSLDKGEHKQPEYLKLNPMGKIPTIIHRNTVITEAAAICAYLADAFPAAQLAPPVDDPRRGTYYRWLFFGAGCVEPAMADKTFPRGATNPRSLAWGSYEDTVNTLEGALKPGPFILGDRFSAADVYVGSEIGWGLMVKSLEPRPSFAAYVGRLNERPAMQRMIEQNKALAQQTAK